MKFIVILFICLIPSFALAETKSFAEKSAVYTVGKKSDAKFSLSISNLASNSKIQTSDQIKLAISIRPEEFDLGKSADFFNVIFVDGKWWMLGLDRAYVPWSSMSLKKLEPFAENIILKKDNDIDLLSGNFTTAGQIKYFLGYITDDATQMVVTPQAFKFTVEEDDSSSETKKEQALSLYKSDVEKNIVQSKCIACHVIGGVARDSKLIFSRPNNLSTENNFNTIRNLLIEKNDLGKHILNKVTGGNSHGGGAQIPSNSDEYIVFSGFIDSLAKSLNSNLQPIIFGSDEADTKMATNILSNIILEDTDESLRRIALIFSGRLPTQVEFNQFRNGKQYAQRKIIKEYMDEPFFHEFVTHAVEERLFLSGGNGSGIFNQQLIRYPYLRQAICNAERNIQPKTDQNLRRKITGYGRRTAHELFYHVIANELPYTEILTANYIMLNSFLNPLLLGTASFNESEDETIFKPSRIEGYINEPDNRDDLEIVNRFPCPGDIGISDTLPYPHAGILTDQSFLDRYPTTATNRNRARARWILYHFLDVDIEKSSQRPVESEDLADTNNPTLNNSKCAVCHTLLDPVAGAFQNWNDFSVYRPVGGTLDRNYKYPQDGSETEYKMGDYWYRDMRPPGLFEHKIENNDHALQGLASLIIKEPGFRTAAVKFWWPAVMGMPLLDRPSSFDDYGYADQLAAYDAQQKAVKEFANGFNQDLNLKELLIDLVQSPWFTGSNSSSGDFTNIQKLSDLGSETRLTPRQLFEKTASLGGYSWGRDFGRIIRNPDLDNPIADYGLLDELKVIYGGIDSVGVLNKQQELTPVMLSVALAHASDAACPIVLKEFILAKKDRRLFSIVEENTTPTTGKNTIKEQIITLFKTLHGKQYAIDDYEVLITYKLFETVWNDKRKSSLSYCDFSDATYFDELLDELDLENLDTITEIGQWGYKYNFGALNDILRPFMQDPNYTKNSWLAVMIYMLSHYDYLYE